MTETRKITMDDLVIQAWELDRLKPAPNNHKKHSEESVGKLARSLADIGQIQPVIVDKEGEIIAGHGRWMAAQKLGWDKIKVIQIPVDRATAIKARIADNLMSNQDIDNTRLAEELNELIGLDVEIDMGGLIMDDGLAELHDMNVEIDFDMDETAVSDEIDRDVDDFSEENEELLETAGSREVPIRKVFGFNSVTPDQARILKDLMAQVMQETDEAEPADALVSWAEAVLYD